MSAQALQQSTCTLTLSDQERDSLLALLRQALGDARIEVHRTHTPGFRESVQGQESIIRALVEKLERTGQGRIVESPMVPAGIEEAAAVIDDLFVDLEGRFQMATEDLEDFIGFLRDHEIRVELEAADAFHSGGAAYGYGRLLHLYDADSVSNFYRTWRQAHGSRAAGATA